MTTTAAEPTFRARFTSLSDVRSPELIAERQNQIVEAAIPLFYRHGFHKTTVRMVADAAGMSMGNLYQYIRTKDDILVLAAVRLMELLDEVFVRSVRPAADSRTRIAELLGGYIEVIDRNRAGTKLLYRESANLGPEVLPEVLSNVADHARHQFAEIIRDGIERDEVDATCNVDVLAMNLLMFAHTWALKGWALKHVIDLPSYKAEQITHALRMIPFRPCLDG